MFEGLQKRWKVNGWRLLLILITFACGGSLGGFVGRHLTNWLDPEHIILYLLVHILLVTLIWPAAVMLVSIPLGQYSFFSKYIARMGTRLFGKKKN